MSESTSVSSSWPSPVGLCTGIASVLVAQVFVLLYHSIHVTYCHKNKVVPIQKESLQYNFVHDMMGHLARPEGFFLLGTYLTVTWMFRLLPSSYYSFEGGVNPLLVFAQLVCVDFFMAIMHVAEHRVSPKIYQFSHKPHHRFLNPKLFDAFDGSVMDTICMILFPLYLTANIFHCNAWEYMAFGSIYASWLCLVHSEYDHPWDPLFRVIGFGTAADHHVHHKLFIYNFGHLFMWWDKLFGTFKSPSEVNTFNVA